ncbi:hypothetical protein [Sphingobacterium thalpophilum]|uniref:Uncharacterized protein n=1 Tax=Sphingobacterium thalpophilum TaxID=259 RepID=A0A4U9URU7_9SPHI|nr:hypothetical protein [Sphingobacterium thalpophilum]VTR34959.1 Uncharacterised protein [Sphingobacterium thalpophilum]
MKTLILAACYATRLCTASDLPLIQTAIDQRCHYDAPGNLAAWLCQRSTVYVGPINGKRYDIGDLAAYEFAQKEFGELVKTTHEL